MSASMIAASRRSVCTGLIFAPKITSRLFGLGSYDAFAQAENLVAIQRWGKSDRTASLLAAQLIRLECAGAVRPDGAPRLPVIASRTTASPRWWPRPAQVDPFRTFVVTGRKSGVDREG